MKKTAVVALSLVLVLGAARIAVSHCEIPCGIFDDPARIQSIREHLGTIEKSMRKIEEIGAAEKPNWNQLNRWIVNKEQHANEIQHLVAQYFMAQRVKLPAAGDAAAQKTYLAQLTSLHGLMVAAMKTKQSTDAEWVTKGHAFTDAFVAAYFGPEDRKKLLGK
jgi:nickel superoxide dismutase